MRRHHAYLPVVALALSLGCAGSPPRAPEPAPAPAPAPDPDATPPVLRLPTDVRPLDYRVELDATPGEPRFSGTVALTVELARPRRIVWLHGQGLDVRRATVDDRPATYREAPGDEGFASLEVPAGAPPIPAGRSVLRFTYEAAVSHGGDAVFEVVEDGRHYLLTTFEPLSARQALPCFDEPGFKVPFTLTLTVPKGDLALANAPLAEETALGDRTRYRFEPTAPLPTYLFSFAVGPFDVVSAPPVPPGRLRPRPLPLRGVAFHGRGPELAYALAQVGPMVTALEAWFDHAYPYAKLDVVAVPGFPGAMENAALILFQDYMLLLDPAKAPIEQVAYALNVLAHEVSHQWFGNLVTMAWWDDLWLNEAFATWIAGRMTATIRPDLDPELGRMRAWREAMIADAQASARRIRQPITGPHDIIAAFDSITYQKGANVIAMFERWVGAPAWQAGVRAYLAARPYGNATADDLLAAVSRAAGRDVATPFRSFLETPGAPLVSVDVGLPVRGELPVTFRVERLRPLGFRDREGAPSGAWQIPVCLAGPGLPEGGASCTLVTGGTGGTGAESVEQRARLPFSGKAATAIAPNAGGSGYYQALVSPEPLLRKALFAPRSGAEAAANAASYLAAFETGRLPAADVLAALAPLGAEDEPELVLALVRLMGWLAEHVWGEDERPALQRTALALFGKTWKRLGWTARRGESMAMQRLRPRLAAFLGGVVRDPAVRDELLRQGRAAIVDDGVLRSDAVSPDVRVSALAVALADGDDAFFERVLATLAKASDPGTRLDLLRALATVAEPRRAARVHALLLDPALTDIEMFKLISWTLEKRATQGAAWRWFRDSYASFAARVPPFELGFMPTLFVDFCDPAARAEIEAFFAAKVDALPGAPPLLMQTLDAIDLCSARVAAQGASARAWLAARR